MGNPLYTDIHAHGSLGALLRNVCTLTPDVEILGFDESFGGSRYWASVKSSGRTSDVSVAIKERLFTTSFWHQGVQMASISTASLPLLVRTIEAWFCQKCDTEHMKRLVPNVEITSWALAYEAGASSYVTHQWHQVQEYIRQELIRVLPVFLIAKATLPLRQLLPFTSHDHLCFSRCTGFPFTNDCPKIVPEDYGRFGVVSQTGERIGGGTPEQVVVLTVENLPVGCGSAIHGTAENVSE